jgi:hypothetical protein
MSKDYLASSLAASRIETAGSLDGCRAQVQAADTTDAAPRRSGVELTGGTRDLFTLG